MITAVRYRYQLLRIDPIARSTAVDNIDEGFLVVDTTETIVDANEQVCHLFETEKSALIGSRFDVALDEHPQFVDDTASMQEGNVQSRLEGTPPKEVEVEVSPLTDNVGDDAGRVMIVHDVTNAIRQQRELKARSTQLRRQNERLEEFAHLVSHDLRNPIEVIDGHLQLLRETDEDESAHYEQILQSLDRMEHIIDDMLTMAKQGQTVTEPKEIALADLCERSWNHVTTKQAALHAETDKRLLADPGRLGHVFENLFRNAIEHGGTDVTITVGDVDSGFYVADDGSGIPEDERDDIFEKGFTTRADGTGFGLAIVRTAIEAHGWEIDVTESADGGARFEITGVEQSPDRADERPVATDD
jgi:PAS domain S-box-containing protein